MEDAGTLEEDDDIDSQDSNIPIDHGHLARNCSIKIITPAVKASVIYHGVLAPSTHKATTLLLDLLQRRVVTNSETPYKL